MASSLLLFTLSNVRLVFIVRNARALLTVSISLIGILILLLLLGGRLIGFMSYAPPVRPGL